MFNGITNIHIKIIISCFMSMVYLCINYKNTNSLYLIVLKLISFPLVCILLIDISIDWWLETFVNVNLTFDISILFMKPISDFFQESSLREPTGSGNRPNKGNNSEVVKGHEP